MVGFSDLFMVHDTSSESIKWHTRLSHIGKDRMILLAREGLLGSLTQVQLPTCESCVTSKATRKPFPKAEKSKATLEVIHSDICGPMNVANRQGTRYFITFIDDYSCYGRVFFIFPQK